MALVPILIGAGVILGGAMAASHTTKRKPIPSDLAAQVLAAFQSRNQTLIAQILSNVKITAEGRWAGQADVLASAVALGISAMAEGTKVPADVSALWWAALASGNPATMRTTATSLATSYHPLSAALLDCAKILGG